MEGAPSGHHLSSHSYTEIEALYKGYLHHRLKYLNHFFIDNFHFILVAMDHQMGVVIAPEGEAENTGRAASSSAPLDDGHKDTPNDTSIANGSSGNETQAPNGASATPAEATTESSINPEHAVATPPIIDSHEAAPKRELNLASRAIHADDHISAHRAVAPAMHVSTTFRYSRNPDDLKQWSNLDVSSPVLKNDHS